MKFIYQKPICCFLPILSFSFQILNSNIIGAFYRLKHILPITLFFLATTISSSQTPLSGIINQYAAVVAINTCESKVTVVDPSVFDVGDEILMVQMKGAIINQTNSSDFGDIEDIGSAGLFEKNEITGINGNEVTLKYLLINDYDAAGSVQLVSFPTFDNAVIMETVMAASWDGSIGGVVALQVMEGLEMEASIDASGIGFRGAQTNSLQNNCNFLTNADDYHYDMANWRGAPKGEGIAAFITDKEQGRGAQANGGGGGNDHNTGGGGGANIIQGGTGGKLSTSGFNCNGNSPGQSGKPLPLDNSRLFMGGGGGAGHDNNQFGTGGGNGGGIVIILTNTITANGFSILADGANANNALGDGAGGGGGGGTVVLQANQIMDLVSISAKGGNGGDVDNESDRCIGPGGGGSGGRLVSNNTNNLDLELTGGEAGENLVSSNQCSDPSNGANAGNAGQQSPFEGIPASDIEVAATTILFQPENKVTCENNLTIFEFLLDGVMLEYQWQLNDGSGWTDIVPGMGYVGETTSILEITNPSVAQNGYSFRCIISGPCINGLASDEVNLTVESAPVPSFDINFLGNNQYEFVNNSANSTSYIWDFGDGEMSNEINPEHTYQTVGQYNVTLTAINGCGEISTIQTIEMGDLLSASFIANFDNPCVPVTVEFEDQSSGQNIQSYNWEFEGGIPSTSTDQNPVVTYSEAGIYDVNLIVENSSGESITFLNDFIEVFVVPIADFEFEIDMLNYSTVIFTNNSSGGSYQLWDFGDGNVSNEPNPVHNYTVAGVYQVVLTVANDGCGSAVSQEIFIEMPNATDEEAFFPNIAIFPNPVADKIHISFSEKLKENTFISLLNSNGQVLQKSLVTSNTWVEDVSNLPSGLYFLRAESAGHTLYFKISKLK